MVKSLLWFIEAIFNAITKDLLPALIAFWTAFLAFLEWVFSKGKKGGQPFTLTSCVPIIHPNFKRPDPLIYDQYYQMSLGLAVTWQNPDIEILQSGAPVASAFDLQPATTYTIKAKILNGQKAGVCAGMPVTFSYLSFGVGTESHPIGQIAVNLGVKGSASCPAFAFMDWTTPDTPGHYCIQVSFVWPDDFNPYNNVGQQNTQVVQALSPATFSFALRNSGTQTKTYRFEYDSFTISPPPLCSDATVVAARDTRGGVSSFARARNSRASNPLPGGWSINFSPQAPSLLPGEQIDVAVTVTPPDNFHGTQPINVHTFSGSTLVGGVTIELQRV